MSPSAPPRQARPSTALQCLPTQSQPSCRNEVAHGPAPEDKRMPMSVFGDRMCDRQTSWCERSPNLTQDLGLERRQIEGFERKVDQAGENRIQ
jgi:hypothetical protein